MEIKITRNPNPAPKPDSKNLLFGHTFTDHMFIMDWNTEKGWHDARIIPFGPLTLHPASTVFHYGEEIFEGLKAYRRPDGKVQLFRAIENVRRMNNSAERLCLPMIPEEDMLQAINTIVDLDRDWVPSEPGTSLYIRPFMYGCDPHLGVHACANAQFVIILSPVGSYYKEGINPVGIMIEKDDVRAVRGGTGYAKCGGNYAASMRAGQKAEEKGYSQVLWLDGVERKYIEEVGAMNVMFRIGDEIVTPKLTGSVLPGITRKSCIEVLKNKGYTVSEKLLSIDELGEALDNSTLKEAWGCGTAAVVSPIGKLEYGDRTFVINNGEIGALTQELYDILTGIQWGKTEDTYGWTTIVE